MAYFFESEFKAITDDVVREAHKTGFGVVTPHDLAKRDLKARVADAWQLHVLPYCHGATGLWAVAACFNFATPEGQGAPPAPGDAREYVTKAVGRMLHAFGVTEGCDVPPDLRAAIREVCGFREPAAPEWVKPGVSVYSQWSRSDRQVVSIGADAVTLTPVLPGMMPETIPTGVFLRSYQKAEDKEAETPCLRPSTPQASGPTLRRASTRWVSAPQRSRPSRRTSGS